MTFLWPAMLLSLLLIPAGIALFVVLGRSRRRRATAYGVTRATSPRRAAMLRRAIPAGLLIAGFGILGVALARPQGVVGLPRFEGTVVLGRGLFGLPCRAGLRRA